MPRVMSPLKDADAFHEALENWFLRARRPLPWREDYEPYHVWISEIMLQQTQMERGVSYYRKWMEKFPDIATLAAASEEAVLRAWEGLGYYSRARAVVRAAAILKERFHCRFPSDPEVIRSLPGVGPYTAAAIASIAFSHDIACVDANVERIVTRLFDIDEPLSGKTARRRVAELAGELLPPGRARTHNQAMMELGALVCGKAPRCGGCPVRGFCLAAERGTARERPVKKAPPETIRLTMTAGLILSSGRCLVLRRPPKGRWGGLWDFPGGVAEDGVPPGEACVASVRERTGLDTAVTAALPAINHTFTNHRVCLQGFLLRPVKKTETPPVPLTEEGTSWQWADLEGLGALAMPSACRRLVEENRLLLASAMPDSARLA